MARHNVIFGRDQAVQQGSARGSGPQWSSSFDAPQAPQYGQQAQYGEQAQYGQPAPQNGQRDDLEAMYARPAATGHDTGRMTMKDALNAITATLGIIIVVGAAVAFAPAALGLLMGEQGLQLGFLAVGAATLVGLIGGLVTGLINAFKKQPSAVLVLLYAGFEGLLLGGISGFMEFQYPGIALQAVVATFAVAGAILLLTRMNVLRTSPKLTKIMGFAMIGYMGFIVVNLIYVLATGGSLRTGLFGMIIGGIAVVMASYCLVSDIEDVQRAAGAGVPRSYAWRCAFGVAATLVWMYIEILRIIAILRGSD